MHDSYVRPANGGDKRPLHVHSLRDTPDMPESDCGLFPVKRHLGQPPRWPVDPQPPVGPVSEVKRTVSRHLYHASAVDAPRTEPHISVMGEIRRPLFHVACE